MIIGELFVIFQVFKDGQHYAKVWPRHAVVAAFTESTVIPAVHLATRWMPALAVINFMVQWQLQGDELLPQAIVTSLFLLSLPLQGWYWLGWRARSALTPQLRAWYADLSRKLQLQPKSEPCYLDLAKMVKRALDELPPDQH